MRDGFLAVTAFCAGLVIMGLEILGFRMFAPFFGYSVYVSGTLIGVVMIALSVGYFLGGMLADKKPDFAVIFHLLIGSVIYIGLVALFYIPLLSFLSGSSPVWGTLIAGMVIFGPPMLLLSMVSPFIIKLIAHAKTVGMAAGKVSGIATIGSIIGVFLTTFFLIPFAGTYNTLIILVVILLVISVAGLLAKSKLYGLAILVLVLFALAPEQMQAGNIIFEEESLYNKVIVEKAEDGDKILRLNSNKWVQSRYNSKTNLTNTYVDFMMVGSLIAKPESVLVLGMGAGSSVLHYLKFTDAQVTAVEIDQLVVDMADLHFNVPLDSPRLDVVVDDARPYLQESGKTFDLIEVDMYHGGIFIPFYVATEEFFELTYDRLSEEGVMVMNVFAPYEHPDRMILTDSIAKTILEVYPSVFYLDSTFNEILVATKFETDLNGIRQRIQAAKPHPTIAEKARMIDLAIKPYEPTDEAMILTDDKAPLEQLTYSLIS